MKSVLRLLPFLIVCAGLSPAHAQDAPAALPAPEVRPEPAVRPAWRDMTDEERRRQREAWRRMSPEERHQLRRDIRDAGAEIYKRRHGRHAPRDD